MQTTSKFNSCSTAPSSPWTCPGAALWKLWACTAVQKLYEPSPTPILCVGLATNVLGRVPVRHLPVFLLGNIATSAVTQHRRGKFPHGLADATDASGKKGSNATR